MPIPSPIANRIANQKKQILALVANQIYTVVAVCLIFNISRTTYYRYRRQAKHEMLAPRGFAPLNHGKAKDQQTVDAVLGARTRYPKYGKKRLATMLRKQGISISPNTVQRILRAHGQALAPKSRPKRLSKSFEAIGPNVIWSMDICYLYTAKKHGFNLYLISIMDDHSRKVVASGLFDQQTVVEVAAVLKTAVLNYGVPRVLVCDNGKQFTCGEFRRICDTIGLEVDYAPKRYPQYKGKKERFYRTVRAEMERADDPQLARVTWAVWIEEYNQTRIHSRVLDAEGEAYPPEFRFTWKPSAAAPLPSDIDIDEVFTARCSTRNSRARQVRADRTISYAKHRYHFPHLHKGDLVDIQESGDQIRFYYQEELIRTISRPPRKKGAHIRKVKAGGVVLFKKRRIEVALAKGTYVTIVYEGKNLVMYADKEVVFTEAA